ncbi:MAG TPA: efflux RND transporter periplasmic adaptor subunit [Gemmataceae bacterium]|jgi:multidrug resistance efflux pump|nr:efflux RND transporter periplasmic adaptor subunit [Gemmataceae bacterium]
MTRPKLLLTLGGVGLVVGGLLFYLIKGTSNGADRARAADGGTQPTVRTIRPKRDANFRIANEQVAWVEPFYQAGVRARASGVVRLVPKEIGEPVRLGEVLVEIDAPELAADVEQKEAVIRQREQELRVSRAMILFADAAVETAQAGVTQRKAEAKSAVATREEKRILLARVKGLRAENNVPEDAVDQHSRAYLAADAAVEAAEAAVEKAKADVLEKKASLEAAKADIDLKSALVRVAAKDRDRAAAMAEFARLTAPFDGVIVKRAVDPGMFVQNATTSATEPLVTIARLDLVTVIMKLPDVAASYISADTDVEVTFLERPELKVHGKVTRFSPAIDGHDKTMRVEVDVFNGTRAEFAKFQAQTFAEALSPFGPGNGLTTAAAVLAAERHRQMFHKGGTEGIAVCPEVPTGSRARPIVPGMTATMKVFLDRVSAAYLIPASAVYGSGGKTYVLLVQNGVTKQMPVRVQVNDGKLAKVALQTGPGSVQELTGDEEFVLSRQLELGDGVKVKTAVGDW